MDNKFFGINPDERATIPDAKRATGFQATQEPYQYINQALFELKTDHIIGTAAQLAAGSCTCKYQSSDQTLRDADGDEVTLSDGDRVYIIGLDTLTDDFDLSAYDRLRVISESSISLANSGQNLIFGDDCVVDIHVSSETNLVFGSGYDGRVNNKIKSSSVLDNIIMSDGNGIDFSGSEGANATNSLFDDYEEGTWTPTLDTTGYGTTATVSSASGTYVKVGNMVLAQGNYTMASDGTLNGTLVYIGNLPYQIASGINGGISFGYINGLSAMAGYTQIVGRVLSGSQVPLYKVPVTSGGDKADLTQSDFVNLSLSFTIVYQTT